MPTYQGSITIKRRPNDGTPGKDAHSPYIGADGYWYYWDDSLGSYVKSNDKAAGEDGLPGIQGPVVIQKEWVQGDTHHYTDEIRDYVYVRGATKDQSYWFTLINKGEVTAGAPPTGGVAPSGYQSVSYLAVLAAKVLIGEEANLANFIFKQGKLFSESGTMGLSGIEGINKDDPSFWSGGTFAQALGLIEFLYNISIGTPAGTGTGQFDYATKYAQLAKITMLHNGAGKYGDFIVLQNGVIIMIDPATGQQRVMFSVQDLPSLTSLLSSISLSGSATNVAVTSSSYTLPNTINVTENGSTITFITDGGLAVNNYKLSADFGINANPNSKIYGFVNLYKDGISYGTYLSVFIDKTTPSVSFAINKTITNCPAGTYSIQIEWVWGSDIDPYVTNITQSIGATTLSWSFIQSGVKRFQFGKNGFMAFYSLLHLYLTETGGLDIKGKTNMPGVLLSATVAADGGTWSAVWGAKQSTTYPYKNSVGRYTVYHTIGHTNYQVYASAYASNRSHYIVSRGTTSFIIEWRTIGSAPALVDTTFDVQVVGNNY